MYNVIYSKASLKDALKLKQIGLKEKVEHLLDILSNNPFQNPPPYEKLSGDLRTAYSRRINQKHRLIYQVDKAHHEVRVLRMWSHYE